MPEQNISLSLRETYSPSQFTRFLWWLSTAEKELLSDAVVDRNRYRIIGMTVLGTWLFATLAWTYFFTTIIDNTIFAIVLGLFMGFIILTIDRALIKGITKQNKNKFTSLIFRGLLALTIGAFMAQPAILYMFDKEIRLQTSLDNEKKKQVKRTELTLLFKDQKKELFAEKNALQKQLGDQYQGVDKARQNFLSETDGSGGSGKIGIRDIAIVKRSEYQKLDEEYKNNLGSIQPRIIEIDKQLTGINDSIQIQEQQFTTYFNNGFLTRIEALNNLISTNPALQTRYYLILIILLLIELMPVIAKTLLPSGTYDTKVVLREEMEKDLAARNNTKERDLKELYNSLAKEHDAETIKAFFEFTKQDRLDKIKLFSQDYKNDKDQSFDGIWAKMKRDVLSKQEN